MQPVLEFIRGIDPILLNSLTFLVGLVAGHHIALIRDKRQEFNSVVGPIRARIISEAGSPMSFPIPTVVELDSFEHLMWPWGRFRLRKAMARYKKEHEHQQRQDMDTGAIYFVDASAVKAAANVVLLSLTRR